MISSTALKVLPRICSNCSPFVRWYDTIFSSFSSRSISLRIPPILVFSSSREIKSSVYISAYNLMRVSPVRVVYSAKKLFELRDCLVGLLCPWIHGSMRLCSYQITSLILYISNHFTIYHFAYRFLPFVAIIFSFFNICNRFDTFFDF